MCPKAANKLIKEEKHRYRNNYATMIKNQVSLQLIEMNLGKITKNRFSVCVKKYTKPNTKMRVMKNFIKEELYYTKLRNHP